MATKTEEKSGADKVTAARNKNLDLAIQQIAKDYGEGAIMRLGGEKIVDIDGIPTGNILIDRALGAGGFPRGRVVEVLGPESSGKTTLALTVLARARKRCGIAVFIDAGDARRKRLESLCQCPSRYSPHRRNQADRRRCHRESYPRQGREEQGGAAVHRGRIRHHVQRRNLLDRGASRSCFGKANYRKTRV